MFSDILNTESFFIIYQSSGIIQILLGIFQGLLSKLFEYNVTYVVYVIVSLGFLNIIIDLLEDNNKILTLFKFSKENPLIRLIIISSILLLLFTPVNTLHLKSFNNKTTNKVMLKCVKKDNVDECVVNKNSYLIAFIHSKVANLLYGVPERIDNLISVNNYIDFETNNNVSSIIEKKINESSSVKSISNDKIDKEENPLLFFYKYGLNIGSLTNDNKVKVQSLNFVDFQRNYLQYLSEIKNNKISASLDRSQYIKLVSYPLYFNKIYYDRFLGLSKIDLSTTDNISVSKVIRNNDINIDNLFQKYSLSNLDRNVFEKMSSYFSREYAKIVNFSYSIFSSFEDLYYSTKTSIFGSETYKLDTLSDIFFNIDSKSNMSFKNQNLKFIEDKTIFNENKSHLKDLSIYQSVKEGNNDIYKNILSKYKNYNKFTYELDEEKYYKDNIYKNYTSYNKIIQQKNDKLDNGFFSFNVDNIDIENSRIIYLRYILYNYLYIGDYTKYTLGIDYQMSNIISSINLTNEDIETDSFFKLNEASKSSIFSDFDIDNINIINTTIQNNESNLKNQIVKDLYEDNINSFIDNVDIDKITKDINSNLSLFIEKTKINYSVFNIDMNHDKLKEVKDNIFNTLIYDNSLIYRSITNKKTITEKLLIAKIFNVADNSIFEQIVKKFRHNKYIEDVYTKTFIDNTIYHSFYEMYSKELFILIDDFKNQLNSIKEESFKINNDNGEIEIMFDLGNPEMLKMFQNYLELGQKVFLLNNIDTTIDIPVKLQFEFILKNSNYLNYLKNVSNSLFLPLSYPIFDNSLFEVSNKEIDINVIKKMLMYLNPKNKKEFSMNFGYYCNDKFMTYDYKDCKKLIKYIDINKDKEDIDLLVEKKLEEINNTQYTYDIDKLVLITKENIKFNSNSSVVYAYDISAFLTPLLSSYEKIMNLGNENIETEDKSLLNDIISNNKSELISNIDSLTNYSKVKRILLSDNSQTRETEYITSLFTSKTFDSPSYDISKYTNYKKMDGNINSKYIYNYMLSVKSDTYNLELITRNLNHGHFNNLDYDYTTNTSDNIIYGVSILSLLIPLPIGSTVSIARGAINYSSKIASNTKLSKTFKNLYERGTKSKRLKDKLDDNLNINKNWTNKVSSMKRKMLEREKKIGKFKGTKIKISTKKFMKKPTLFGLTYTAMINLISFIFENVILFMLIIAFISLRMFYIVINIFVFKLVYPLIISQIYLFKEAFLYIKNNILNFMMLKKDKYLKEDRIEDLNDNILNNFISLFLDVVWNYIRLILSIMIINSLSVYMMRLYINTDEPLFTMYNGYFTINTILIFIVLWITLEIFNLIFNFTASKSK